MESEQKRQDDASESSEFRPIEYPSLWESFRRAAGDLHYRELFVILVWTIATIALALLLTR